MTSKGSASIPGAGSPGPRERATPLRARGDSAGSRADTRDPAGNRSTRNVGIAIRRLIGTPSRPRCPRHDRRFTRDEPAPRRGARRVQSAGAGLDTPLASALCVLTGTRRSRRAADRMGAGTTDIAISRRKIRHLGQLYGRRERDQRHRARARARRPTRRSRSVRMRLRAHRARRGNDQLTSTVAQGGPERSARLLGTSFTSARRELELVSRDGEMRAPWQAERRRGADGRAPRMPARPNSR